MRSTQGFVGASCKAAIADASSRQEVKQGPLAGCASRNMPEVLLAILCCMTQSVASADAEEVGDEWSICIFKWLLGSYGPALTALIPHHHDAGGERMASSAQSKPRPEEDLTRNVGPALLDLLRHCWDQGWVDQLPCADVHAAAIASAQAQEHDGFPLLALEALQVTRLGINDTIMYCYHCACSVIPGSKSCIVRSAIRLPENLAVIFSHPCWKCG